MTISKYDVENILKTLPIGYYIGRNVDVNLTDENATYYDMMNDVINISYPMLAHVINDVSLAEKDIRCLLYHEISHAFLTPSKLKSSDIVNVFEDERIESILRYYYRDVNFREFIKRFNGFNNQKPKSAFEMFYQVVRYRFGPKQFVDRVHDLINKYYSLKRTSTETYYYRQDIEQLYNDIYNYFNDNATNKSKDTSSSQNSDTGNSENKSQSSSDNNVDELFNSAAFENETTGEDLDNYDHSEFNKSIAKCIIQEVVDSFEDPNIEADINRILSSVKRSAKANSTAINAYSGVFNPRSLVRTDYKYFVHQNRAGHVKAFSKIHLNLFIDSSGSFTYNDLTTNKILKALTKFENSNSNFSFDLISCGKGQQLRAKNDRVQKSSGCNYLDHTIYDMYRKQQYADAENINIVLFDGDAFSYVDRVSAEEKKRFEVFNNRNTILISDDENESYISRYCQNTKVIITKNYTTELYKHVIYALQALCK